MEGLVTKSGDNPGKTVTIIGGLHGNETGGILALKRTISDLKIASGKVNFIFGNPRAIERGVRFTEMNLNRAFKEEKDLRPEEIRSYERNRAIEIEGILRQSDALLDIHSSETPNSPPFIICDKAEIAIANKLPFRIATFGWDNLESGSTDHFMHNLGKIGICVECGTNGDPKSADKAYEAILSFLKIFNVIDGKDIRPDYQQVFNCKYIYITKFNFRPIRSFQDFEPVKKGENIGFDGDKVIKAEFDGFILFCRTREKEGTEAFILAEEYNCYNE